LGSIAFTEFSPGKNMTGRTLSHMKAYFDLSPLKKAGLPLRLRGRAGFSLVEVVLSIGVVSFALMALVGTLPVGLQTVQDSRLQAAKSNIIQHMRGVLQQISFTTNSTSDLNIENLSQHSIYYTDQGMETTTSTNAYYRASFEVANADVGSSGSLTSFSADNAKMIRVHLSYPAYLPENKQKTNVFSLFSAKQGAN